MKTLALLVALMGSGTYDVTGYSWGCGATGLTASGTEPIPLFTVAADPAVLRPGTLVRMRGPWVGGRVYRVEDTGHLVKGRTLDLMMSSCLHATWWGRRPIRVDVVGYAKITRRR